MHTAVSRVVEYLELTTGVKSSSANTVLHGYRHFEALTDRSCFFSISVSFSWFLPHLFVVCSALFLYPLPPSPVSIFCCLPACLFPLSFSLLIPTESNNVNVIDLQCGHKAHSNLPACLWAWGWTCLAISGYAISHGYGDYGVTEALTPLVYRAVPWTPQYRTASKCWLVLTWWQM